MLKKRQVVMLPTNQKANLPKLGEWVIYLTTDNKLGIDKLHSGLNIPTLSKSQHLYFLSDEEIKEGDWVYCDHVIKSIIQVKNKRVSGNDSSVILLNNGSLTGEVWEKYSKKIIATTDESLTNAKDSFGNAFTSSIASQNKLLPQPSDSFLKVFVEEYNKGNLITEVMVEYNDKVFANAKEILSETLKVNPKDNTITIRPTKTNWSREEVIEFAQKYARMVQEKPIQMNAYKAIHNTKWIQENL